MGKRKVKRQLISLNSEATKKVDKGIKEGTSFIFFLNHKFNKREKKLL